MTRCLPLRAPPGIGSGPSTEAVKENISQTPGTFRIDGIIPTYLLLANLMWALQALQFTCVKLVHDRRSRRGRRDGDAPPVSLPPPSLKLDTPSQFDHALAGSFT